MYKWNNTNEIKGRDCKEDDIYFALDFESGYPVRKFTRFSDCVSFCHADEDSYYPVTNDYKVIIDW